MPIIHIVHIDPGHGWLEVPEYRLAELGIADRISHYSYRHGGKVYLEEDCDMTVYLDADPSVNMDKVLIIDHPVDAFIRDLPRYTSR